MNILLVNDDGPPCAESPFIFGLYKHLKAALPDANIKVVIPSSQKSWIGKAYHIKEITKGVYYYPRDPDGAGEISEVSRPLKEGELAEWILLDGTPATCSNIGLYNLFPTIKFDLISGPNLGRNSSTAFTMSSGTVGAAMSAALSGTRSIALSYGTVLHPTPEEFLPPAHTLALQIIQHLLANWGLDSQGGKVNLELYSVNIPLIEQLLSDEGLKVYWTTLWKNSYSQLFKPASQKQDQEVKAGSDVPSGPTTADTVAKGPTSSSEGQLLFKWAPDLRHIVNPKESLLPAGSDAWALYHNAASVTPLRTSFGEDPVFVQEQAGKQLKLKL